MADPSAPSLRDRIAQAVHEEQSVDAVLAVLADADPTDLWGLVWRRLGNARPRTEEAHTVDVGHVHVLTTPGGTCAPTCPHPHHRAEETPDA